MRTERNSKCRVCGIKAKSNSRLSHLSISWSPSLLLVLLVFSGDLHFAYGKPKPSLNEISQQVKNNVSTLVQSLPQSSSIGDAWEENPELGPYFEGDILPDLVSKSGLADDLASKSGLIDVGRHWPNAEVFYEICDSFTEDEISSIMQAIEIIQQYTCIKFTVRDQETNYVNICNSKSGCSSHVGFQGAGEQSINLSPSCLKKTNNNPSGTGTAVHEMIHCLGFKHEQAREDRDDFVQILVDNIQPDKLYNFDKAKTGTTNTYSVPYDYGSVMHYSATAFAITSGQPTIVPLKSPEEIGDVKMGQRQGPTYYDIVKVCRMYGCTEPDPTEIKKALTQL